MADFFLIVNMDRSRLTDYYVSRVVNFLILEDGGIGFDAYVTAEKVSPSIFGGTTVVRLGLLGNESVRSIS